jgi:MFS family permease
VSTPTAVLNETDYGPLVAFEERAVSRKTIIGFGLAVALVPLNSTMVAVALPKVAHAFGIGRGRAGVLITVYLVAMLLGQPLAGRVCDAFGTKRVAMISILGFAGCSVAASVSPTFQMLVVARGFQAVFASALAPSAQSMLRSLTPQNQRGHTFGILGSVIGIGAASGPIIGGVLVGSFGWKSIFLVNLPVAATSFLVLAKVDMSSPLHDDDTPAPTGDARSGPGPVHDLALTVGPGPLIYLAAFATQAFANLSQYLLLLMAPIVLDHQGWNARPTGLALSALTVGFVIMGPRGGRFGDSNGRANAITNGLGIALLGTFLLVPFDINVPPSVLVGALALFGLGIGFASPSIIAAGLEAAPEERSGAAAGILASSRYVGNIVASLLLSIFVADDGSGIRLLYIVAVVALVLAIGATQKLSTHRPRSLR